MSLGIKGILLALLASCSEWVRLGHFSSFRSLPRKNSFSADSGRAPAVSPNSPRPPSWKSQDSAHAISAKLRTGTKTTVDFLLRNPTDEKLRFKLAGSPPAALEIDIPAEGAVINANSTYR